ncbi:MAG: ATP-binding cassette domain-containing protein [Clostridiales bacterium]|nr:ATP-binding cassette domain-containing protein [Clostridiales bacterium]
MSILDIKNLSHMYDAKTLFAHADLSINNGEHVGVVGLNGAGKTTFINIISGVLSQDEGEVKWQNGIKRGVLDQHADIDRSQTVMEYLKDAFRDLYDLNARMEQLYVDMGEITDDGELSRMIDKTNRMLERLTNAGFFELDATVKKVAGGIGIASLGYDTVIATLSGGQRAKLMLARLLLEQPDVMLLDEPTNFLDVEHVDWLIEYLNSVKNTFLVISHDTEFLDKVCKFIVSIENGTIKKYGGNYTTYRAQAEQNRKQYEESYLRQQEEIKRMEDYIARNKARASTAGMANSRKKMLDRMEKIEKPSVVYDAEFSFPCEPLHTRELIKANELLIGYDHPLLPPVTFGLEGDSRLWVRGTNGIGKTTLVKTLMGLLAPKGGSVYLHPFLKPGYLEQDLNFGQTEQSALGLLSDLFPRLQNKQLREKLSKVGIKNELCVKPLRTLSGGEQVRVKLCVLMQKTTNILLLDEPTNHLDVRAKAALKTALLNYHGAILLVSHERDFAEDVCNKTLDVKA